jgi:hypothetical protein
MVIAVGTVFIAVLKLLSVLSKAFLALLASKDLRRYISKNTFALKLGYKACHFSPLHQIMTLLLLVTLCAIEPPPTWENVRL